jgi:OHCU decarboxylase
MPETSRLAELNAMGYGDAVSAFMRCCAARPWAQAMAAVRPFHDVDALLRQADGIWWLLGPDVWRRAMDGHPRIGESRAAMPADEIAERWSRAEQSAAQAGADGVRAALAVAQQEYEARYGHIFLICADGLDAAQILDALRARLGNDPAAELLIAAEEQRRITRLRLEKLLTS